MGRSSRSRRRGSAFAPTSMARSASWGPRPRWRSRRRSAPTSRSCSTSARRFTSAATTPRARWSAPIGGWTAAWTGMTATGPRGRSSTGSSRAAWSTTSGWSPRAPWPPAAAPGSPSAARWGRTRHRCTRWWTGRRPSWTASPPTGRATCWASARSTTSSPACARASTRSTAPCPPGSGATAWRSCRRRRRAGGWTSSRAAGSARPSRSWMAARAPRARQGSPAPTCTICCARTSSPACDW